MISHADVQRSLVAERSRTSWREVALFVTVFTVILLGLRLGNDEPFATPHTDATRYIDYAVSMNEFGVFGLTFGDLSKKPKPSNANAPLYPLFIAGLMKLDPALADTIYCWNARDPKTRLPANTHCVANVNTFLIAQGILTIISLLLVFILALQLLSRPVAAWTAAFLAFAAGVFAEFEILFMTEMLVLPMFFGLLVFVLQFYEKPIWQWALAIGLTLGLLTLVRPTYLYLFFAFGVVFVALSVVRRNRAVLSSLAALIIGFAILTTPWSYRNKVQIGEWALSGGNYAELILMQRFAYNRMSWPEVATAFVYYLPDFGDSLAEQLVAPACYDKLGWDGQSYYRQGVDRREFAKEVEKAGGREHLVPYWIRTELVGNAPKNIAVSAVLAWRGTFVAKYWGLFGFIAFVSLLALSIRAKSYALLVVSLPVLFMIALHGAVSVSIPRYNLPIMALYAAAMSFYLSRFGYTLMTVSNFPAPKYREAFRPSV